LTDETEKTSESALVEAVDGDMVVLLKLVVDVGDDRHE